MFLKKKQKNSKKHKYHNDSVSLLFNWATFFLFWSSECEIVDFPALTAPSKCHVFYFLTAILLAGVMQITFSLTRVTWLSCLSRCSKELRYYTLWVAKGTFSAELQEADTLAYWFHAATLHDPVTFQLSSSLVRHCSTQSVTTGSRINPS